MGGDVRRRMNGSDHAGFLGDAAPCYGCPIVFLAYRRRGCMVARSNVELAVCVCRSCIAESGPIGNSLRPPRCICDVQLVQLWY